MTLPLLMVSQIQRSGGSLMAQLFDGHPQLLAHPFEIQIGHPQKWDWPSLDLQGQPLEWFELLYEKKLDEFIAGGYKKPGSNPHAHREVFEFKFDKHQFKERFERKLRETPPSSSRAILNVYFAEFFTAWGDYTVSGHERFVSGFTPRLFMMDPSLERLDTDYPDGVYLSIIRDPKSWYASSSRHSESYADPNRALEEWAHSTRTSLALQKQFPGRFKCFLFSDLIRDPIATMKQVCLFTNIEYVNSLTEPTFLGEPVFPNSSFEINKKGINQNMLNRDASLTAEALSAIEGKARPLYDEAVEQCTFA